MSNNSVGLSKSDNRFSLTVDSKIAKSKFNLDQTIKTTFNAGYAIPFYLLEILPGDQMNVDLSFVSRMTSMIHAPMDNLELDFYFFFVPNRIAWTGWQALHGENQGGLWVPNVPPTPEPCCINSSTTVAVPAVSKSLGDYYGIPLNYVLPPASAPLTRDSWCINSLPFRGYNLIWNRWFRDQNLMAPVVVNTALATDSVSAGARSNNTFTQMPLRVCKKPDYFTSALAQASKGVASNIATNIVPTVLGQGTPDAGGVILPSTLGALWQNVASSGSVTTGNANSYIQRLRTAFQLTKLFERDARVGTRYIEVLRSHFGVQAEDYRLQFPEFLGHHHSVVGVQQVAQTSSTDVTSPQANISAFSLTARRKQFLFSKSFVEHGYVHGIVVARQRKTYQNGIDQHWFCSDRFDRYYPELAHIAEQPIFQREIFISDTSTPLSVFAFQEAWARYRYMPNRVTGGMRSDAVDTRETWHYADKYSTPPVFNASWIQDNSDINVDRTLAVPSTSTDQIFADIRVHCLAVRPMPVYSVPGLVDHF